MYDLPAPCEPGAIAVLTVNWNRPHLTLQCLQALRRSEGAHWHLFVVDNASSDDSVQQLSDLGPDVTLIRSGVNSGWAGGNNMAARVALDAGYDRLFFLNNDAAVAPGTLAALMMAGRGNPQWLPIVGAVQLDGDEGAGSFYGARHTLGEPLHHHLTRAEFDGLGDNFATSFIKGAAIFCHRKHVEHVGSFDERFFLNFEEQDWCVRARAMGYPVVMAKAAVVHHEGSGSMGGYHSPMSTYFLVRNALLYAEKNGGWRMRGAALHERLSWIKGYYGGIDWPLALSRFVRSRDPWAAAFKLGLRDYLLRQFGDCPAIIRQLNGSAAAQRRQMTAAAEPMASLPAQLDPTTVGSLV